MEAGITAGWADFMVAAAGAAAALAGLVFVSISINLAKILELPGVASRAGETIIVLSGSLACALVTLIPHLTETSLSWLILAFALPTWAVPLVIQIDAIRNHTYYHGWHIIFRSSLHQLATLPGLLSVLAVRGILPGGLIWLAAGLILAMMVSIQKAWVLLIEILR